MNDDAARRHSASSNNHSFPHEGLHPSVEQLSEYLDEPEAVDAVVREAIEGHLTSCQECQAALSDLRMMVATLGALPVREAPRSYAITPAMLEPSERRAPAAPVVLQESAQWHARHAAKVRWATAVAALLFVFVISADLVTNGIRPMDDSGNQAASDVSTMQDGAGSEESISALPAEEPEPVPTVAVAEEAVPESAEEAVPESSDAMPPVAEEEAEEESDEPASAEMPESDDAESVVPDDTAARSSEEGESDEAGDADDETMSFSVEEEAISDEPTSETAPESESSSQMRWRVVEVTLALVLALLLAVMIGLPKQRGTRRH